VYDGKLLLLLLLLLMLMQSTVAWYRQTYTASPADGYHFLQTALKGQVWVSAPVSMAMGRPFKPEI
jgi:hypothetical protein